MGRRGAGSKHLTLPSNRSGMMSTEPDQSPPSPQIVYALGERPAFRVGDPVRVGKRLPVGHYRVPRYLRGKAGIVEAVIEPAAVDNEQEGFGRNAGGRRHYYRIAVLMNEIWEAYQGSPRDSLHIEVFETWLERL